MDLTDLARLRQQPSTADVLRSGPGLYDLMSDPRFAQGVADAPRLMRTEAPRSPAALLDIGALAARVLGEATSPQRSDAVAIQTMPDAAVLMGPAKYAIQRASPPLARHLDRSPVGVYARFGEFAPPHPADTLGSTRAMDATRARETNVLHDILGGLRFPTPETVHSGSFLRGTSPPPWRPLKQPLQAGDIDITLHSKYDPTSRLHGYPFDERIGYARTGPVPTGRRGAHVYEPKTHALLDEQAETAIHEGVHAAWLAKQAPAVRQRLGDLMTKLERGALTDTERQDLAALSSLANPPGHPSALRGNLLDLDELLRVFGGQLSPEHAALTSAARRAAGNRNR